MCGGITSFCTATTAKSSQTNVINSQRSGTSSSISEMRTRPKLSKNTLTYLSESRLDNSKCLGFKQTLKLSHISCSGNVLLTNFLKVGETIRVSSEFCLRRAKVGIALTGNWFSDANGLVKLMLSSDVPRDVC